MNRILSVLISIVFLVAFAGCKKNRTDVVYDKSYMDEIKLARKDFGSYLVRNQIPGATIAIAKENKLIYSEGIGLASKELKVPMTRENKLRIGDVSQIFTSIIYLKLVEDGVLEPDSSVQYYVKEYPESENKIRLKHLPYHATGIRKANPSERNLSGFNPSIQRGLKSFMYDELESSPGWFEELSMFNTNLLGAVMERVTEKRFPQLLKDYITDTLRLTNTVVDDPVVTIEGRTNFYDRDLLGKVINAPFQDMRYKAPSSGILSNAEDLVNLGMAILDSDYFSEEFAKKLFKPCDLIYGNYKSKMANGWLLTSDEKGRDLNASSSIVSGGGATILIYPKEKLVIAYALNLTLDNDKSPVLKIANYFLEESKSN